MVIPNKSLAGKICVVTGATRGIGRGIAIQLGEAGATVYITGRTLTSKDGMGSLEDTATEIRNRGGVCVPCVVDHENDVQISGLFDKINTEQNGRLDVLVNNAYKAVNAIFDSSAMNFWETKPEIWDDINNVGLRNHYICTVYAARLMVPRKSGLIINVSSWGGAGYIFNVAYGIGKCALDRMAADCGVELKKHNVTMISLYPGAVNTEIVVSKKLGKGNSVNEVFNEAESTEFSGRIVAQLAQDANVMQYTSKVLIGAEYALNNGIRDIDDRVILSMRSIKYLAGRLLPNGLKFIANFIPASLRIPQYIIDISKSKFY